jgi:hypothetical protein
MARKPVTAAPEPAGDASAVGWEFGGYYLDVPHPERGGVYYACRYDAGTRSVRRRSLRTADSEAAKQALVALCAAAPARAADECPDPRSVLTLHVLEAYLTGHATTIASEEQAIRAVAIVTEYLRDEVKNLAAPVSLWTPSRQLDLARYCHKTFSHTAATIDRVLNVLGAAMNDAAAVKMRPDPLGTVIEGALVSHVPSIVYRGARIAKELKISMPKKGGFVPTLQQMATFIDAVQSKHLRRWVILALNTWARPEAITDFDPTTQYERSTGALDLNPPGRIQTNKRRPILLAPHGLSDWLDHWQQEDIAAFQKRYGTKPNAPIPLLVYKGERVGTVQKAIKRIADECGVPELTQRSIRAFMATHVRKMCPLVSRERRSLWLGHTVNEGSLTTEHYEAFDVDVLEDVALATDFVLTELQKLTAKPLFAVEMRLNGGEIRRLGARPSTKKALSGSGLDGGRHRDRTCDHSRVKGVLYR